MRLNKSTVSIVVNCDLNIQQKKGESMKNNLIDFDINVLIRLWFRLLWQKYDLGGISVGRSLRCDLLDCFLDFSVLPELQLGADEYSEGLESEILGRPLVEPSSSLKPEDVCRYSKEQVALAGLGALLALEFSVHADIAWKNGYELERKKIKAVLEHFSYIEIPTTLDIQKVSQTLLARKSDIQYEECMSTFINSSSSTST